MSGWPPRRRRRPPRSAIFPYRPFQVVPPARNRRPQDAPHRAWNCHLRAAQLLGLSRHSQDVQLPNRAHPVPADLSQVGHHPVAHDPVGHSLGDPYLDDLHRVVHLPDVQRRAALAPVVLVSRSVALAADAAAVAEVEGAAVEAVALAEAVVSAAA